MQPAFIFDIDGTLANLDHRLHYVRDGAKEWGEFFARCHEDTLYVPIAKILEALYRQSYSILLVSGRPERCREVTREWLAENGVFYDHLYMRPDSDVRPDHIVKMQILDGIIEDGYEVVAVVDDRESVVQAWRDRGLTCLQCAPSMVSIPPTAVLNLMVGPACAGKSDWLKHSEAAWNRFGIKQHHILSSDMTRGDLTGDFQNQSANAEVFAAIHAVAKTRLMHGLPTTIDATHIKRRDRIQSATLVNCRVRYLVFNRPMFEKYRDGGWRMQIMKNGEPFDLIKQHEDTFRSQLKEILAGDGLPNVEVHDLRRDELKAAA